MEEERLCRYCFEGDEALDGLTAELLEELGVICGRNSLGLV